MKRGGVSENFRPDFHHQKRDKDTRGLSQSADRLALPFLKILIPRRAGVECMNQGNSVQVSLLSFHERGNTSGSYFGK
jgi:hypothetical protein